MRTPHKKVLQIAEWVNSPVETRVTQRELAKQLGLSVPTVMKHRQRLESEAQEVDNEEDYNSVEWLGRQTAASDRALLMAVKKGNAQAIKIFYQLMDRLREKVEAKLEIGLTAIEHRNIRAEGQRILQEELNNRTGGTGGLLARIQGVHSLSGEVRLDNQSEHLPDS